MPEFWCAGSLNLSCISDLNCASALPPRPLYAAPGAFLPLHLAPPVALVVFWWLWRILLPFELFAGRGDDHLPAILEEQPPRAWTLLDADRVGDAAAAVRGVLEKSIRPTPLSPGGSPRASTDGYFRYPQIKYYLQLEAVRGVRLFDSKAMEEMARGLPYAVEMLRQASIQYDDTIRRLSDVAWNPSIFHANPCGLVTESTDIVIKLKIATAVVCLIGQELNGQNPQLCQEVREECFALVAGQSIEKLLEVARSFSDASWCACHIKEVLTIFDALIDVLYNVHGLPLNRYDEVVVTLSKMVDALGVILGGTISDIDNSEESTIHPATVVFKQVLELFGSNTDIVQSILVTGDRTIDPYSHMFHCWARKLEEDAERICQGQEEGQKCQRQIILLNNAYDVWQMMRCPGASFSNVKLMSSLICRIQQYRKSYFDECWVPLVGPLKREDYLRNPRRSSLDEFSRGFVSICCHQMTWKVVPALRYELRDEIKNAVVTPYKAFVCALQANPARRSVLAYLLKRFVRRKKNLKDHTVEQLENNIDQIFEG
uniref:Uncharacterized protein n=1 Tax=Avena sativa TaxID=4498 RepID=A0ACD5YZR7_AVESA